MTDDLIRQLREGGYDGAADQVRDAEIAKQLRDAGRDDLAETLEGKTEPAAPKNPVEAEAEQFLKTLKEKNESAWTSAGGLLD